MMLTLKAAGDKQQKVDIQKDDKIKVEIYDCGIFTGYVDTMTQDYISIRDIVSIEPCYPCTSIYIKNPQIFYNEEIHSIEVIEEKGGVA